ncbi:AMP-binding protein [Actinomadura craniellae]|uniref:AMP-binding protein n=1 Tax=Actinomadura craniellae TaxID=2231787 RepID=A0A365H6S8_9ACTN|nr:protein kinase family protein [Actinomadura craniellae]RAY14718.1 AMP-binding protein [Actinomadura craniellae]
MSTSTIEPGTRLAGRYRLETRVSEAGGSTLWKAIDEILARAVAVRTFDPTFARAGQVVTAARAASRLTDPRLTQVFDADDSGELAYVVSEWVTGETLEQMLLAKGPLEPGRAATLLYEAAEAVAAAHAAGLAHLRLTPRDLLWTTGGTVKLLGMAVDAVLADETAADPALADTQGLGRLLYAALTARWPGEQPSSLPDAPAANGELWGPRQVKPGVPHLLDSLVCQALHVRTQQPMRTPDEFVSALGGVPRTPLPLFAGPATGPPPAVVHRPVREPATALHTPAPPPPTRPHPHPHSRTRPASPAPIPAGGAPKSVNRALLGVAAAAVTVIVGLAAWSLTRGDSPPAAQGTPTPTPTATRPAVQALDVQSVHGFDPTPLKNPDTAYQTGTRNVIDGKGSTEWHTQHYFAANYAGLKQGLGLVLDMGRPVTVGKVKVVMPGGVPGTVRLHIGDSPDLTSRQAARMNSAIGTFELDTEQARGRYVLVYFSKLPQIEGKFRAVVKDVVVYGAG